MESFGDLESDKLIHKLGDKSSGVEEDEMSHLRDAASDQALLVDESKFSMPIDQIDQSRHQEQNNQETPNTANRSINKKKKKSKKASTDDGLEDVKYEESVGTFVVDIDELKTYLRSYYEKCNPKKIPLIPSLIKKFRGREDILCSEMERKYGILDPPIPLPTRIPKQISPLPIEKSRNISSPSLFSPNFSLSDSEQQQSPASSSFNSSFFSTFTTSSPPRTPSIPSSNLNIAPLEEGKDESDGYHIDANIIRVEDDIFEVKSVKDNQRRNNDDMNETDKTANDNKISYRPLFGSKSLEAIIESQKIQLKEAQERELILMMSLHTMKSKAEVESLLMSLEKSKEAESSAREDALEARKQIEDFRDLNKILQEQVLSMSEALKRCTNELAEKDKQLKEALKANNNHVEIIEIDQVEEDESCFSDDMGQDLSKDEHDVKVRKIVNRTGSRNRNAMCDNVDQRYSNRSNRSRCEKGSVRGEFCLPRRPRTASSKNGFKTNNIQEPDFYHNSSSQALTSLPVSEGSIDIDGVVGGQVELNGETENPLGLDNFVANKDQDVFKFDHQKYVDSMKLAEVLQNLSPLIHELKVLRSKRLEWTENRHLLESQNRDYMEIIQDLSNAHSAMLKGINVTSRPIWRDGGEKDSKQTKYRSTESKPGRQKMEMRGNLSTDVSSSISGSLIPSNHTGQWKPQVHVRNLQTTKYTSVCKLVDSHSMKNRQTDIVQQSYHNYQNQNQYEQIPTLLNLNNRDNDNLSAESRHESPPYAVVEEDLNSMQRSYASSSSTSVDRTHAHRNPHLTNGFYFSALPSPSQSESSEPSSSNCKRSQHVPHPPHSRNSKQLHSKGRSSHGIPRKFVHNQSQH